MILADILLQILKNWKVEGVRIMENRAHHRDRMDASFHVVSLFLQDSKCGVKCDDGSECVGYLYPPKKTLMEETLSEADFKFRTKNIIDCHEKKIGASCSTTK